MVSLLSKQAHDNKLYAEQRVDSAWGVRTSISAVAGGWCRERHLLRLNKNDKRPISMLRLVQFRTRLMIFLHHFTLFEIPRRDMSESDETMFIFSMIFIYRRKADRFI